MGWQIINKFIFFKNVVIWLILLIIPLMKNVRESEKLLSKNVISQLLIIII